ncbi:NADH:flavin oxidoreductase/NADH oxidase [Salinibacterium sp. SYSU T00001]|uniref:NADH:flavin oxidoreductase/NADH oxidase n=1 Tax=Homoserinimonas sedimenticola TaxID=2986805 RepID=UPI0022358F52|nr:NADH:flavin oxidoreductase/NADH oxidase [Salinibacterium sedimenticola]MCW4386614.1 NADH:flavin oxidoreductase/NADH oxidase [Salinibacterium sedimenticola]
MSVTPTAPLFTPLKLRTVEFRNRLWVAPMCQYSVDREDGVPTDWHVVHLGALARGGAGLVMTEATAVLPEGRISAEDTGLYSDEQQSAWARIVEFVHSQGAVAGIQLAHSGRKGSMFREWGPRGGITRPQDAGGWQTVAPSPLAFGDYASPVELDEEGIHRVIDGFAASARRAVDAGFDVIEVHAAHGYLLHEFLSPLSNSRTDAWGGDLEGRAALLLRVVEAVRGAIGEALPLFVRFSATDWASPEQGPSWDPEQMETVGRWLVDLGVDLFDVSSGGNLPHASIPAEPGYQVGFAEGLRSATGAPVSAVGLITTAQQANQIIEQGRADAVMMGRKLMRDPHYPRLAALELGVETDAWPPAYARSLAPLDRW